MNPSQRYQQLISTKKFSADPMQQQVITELQRIYDDLQKQRITTKKLLKFVGKSKPVKGLYLYGGVGIGKTWLMDIFYQCLPGTYKHRMHFHRFMADIHSQLTSFQGEKNPLAKIAKNLAKEIRVLCFDEFFVSDITDAMLLAGLLEALFAEGISLVATSNIAPTDLYKGGLQRDRFLPAIELIRQNTKVLHMPSEQDYRMRYLEKAGIYYYPLNAESQKQMRRRFEELADSDWSQGEILTIKNRPIATERLGKSIVWFHFKTLCNIPRSQLDYIEIAKSFHTVLLSGIPQFHEQQTNEALYLINLVDVFYDAKVKLIISAETKINELYQKGALYPEFQRTLSRLQEMQSWEYLRQPHIS